MVVKESVTCVLYAEIGASIIGILKLHIRSNLSKLQIIERKKVIVNYLYFHCEHYFNEEINDSFKRKVDYSNFEDMQPKKQCSSNAIDDFNSDVKKISKKKVATQVFFHALKYESRLQFYF